MKIIRKIINFWNDPHGDEYAFPNKMIVIFIVIIWIGFIVKFIQLFQP